MEEKKYREEAAAREVLQELKTKKKRASGFGHRVHTSDPRTKKLFQLAEDLGLSGIHVNICRVVEQVLTKDTGKPLPANVDGAIAALLCDLEIPSAIGNAFFIISRVAGLVAQVHEEKTRMRPMRKIHPQDIEYDGAKERKL